MFWWKSVAFLIFWFQISCQKSTPEDPSYIAAVVEYSPCNLKNSDTIWWNVLTYADYIENASKADADIIVFPEGGLTGRENHLEENLQIVPDPRNKSVPCVEYTGNISEVSEIVSLLSCKAWLHKIYVVVNLPEKVLCSKDKDKNCPAKGRYRYNTNVVFDRNGAVIARYRKYNLYDEDHNNKPLEAEAAFFDTDFGVRFGTFTCFDILFAKPAIDLVTKYNVTDIAFPTAWYSELPFLTALQVQQGWAYAHNVNFLGAGYNNVSVGSGGSGIFPARSKDFVRIMPENNTSQLLLTSVRKKENRIVKQPPNQPEFNANIVQQLIKALISALKEANSKKESINCPVTQEKETKDNLYLIKDTLNAYKSSLLNIKETNGQFEKTICDGDEFCCSFNITYDKPKTGTSYYRAVAFNGVRKAGKKLTTGVQICSIISCTSTKKSDCTARPKTKNFGLNFTKIVVSGNFLNENASQFPVTLTDGDMLVPLSPESFIYTVTPSIGNSTIEIALKTPSNNLTTFGIYGRVFSNDGKPSTSNSTKIFLNKSPILVALLTLFIFFWK